MATDRTLTMKAIGWLLAYPVPELVKAGPEITGCLEREGLLSPERLADIRSFVDRFDSGDLIDVQEAYVDLFDKSRQVSLHLFEHVHGESRERGMAMVNLREVYAQAGLVGETDELPDFLPMYLEYLSLLSPAGARSGLRDVAPILQQVHHRLGKRGSDYACLFGALLDLAGVSPLRDADAGVPLPADDTMEAIDRAWEEHAVAFGPDNDPQNGKGCDRAATMIDRMRLLDEASGRAGELVK